MQRIGRMAGMVAGMTLAMLAPQQARATELYVLPPVWWGFSTESVVSARFFRGCLTSEPGGICGVGYLVDPAGDGSWVMGHQPVKLNGGSRTYLLTDDWTWSTADGTCVGAGVQAFASTDCEVQRADELTLSTTYSWQDDTGAWHYDPIALAAIDNPYIAYIGNTVPEPATLALFAPGLLGLAWFRRRRVV